MKALKKLISMFTASAILAVGSIGVLPEEGIGGFAFSVRAADIVDSGECGQLTWTLDGEDTLTISGKGAMTNWSSSSAVPWHSYHDDILNVKIENGVTSIGSFAFYYCYSLTTITIPDSVTSIGDCAFYHCYGLTSITIPDSVTSIGDDAFYNCDNLTSITIPDSVTSIGSGAFEDCSSLTAIDVDTNNEYYASEDGVLFNKNKTVLIRYPIKKDNQKYMIPDSVTSIGSSAFEFCDNLTSITIPDSVTSIGLFAFYDCSSLTAIDVDTNNEYYASEDGVLFNKNKTVLIQYPMKKDNQKYMIPDSVTSIGDFAFEECSSLTFITIPDSVTTIEYCAFNQCYSLTSITIPDSVTSIGNGAFQNCDSLTSITIPDSVTSIGSNAFGYCDNLTYITIPDSVTSIADRAFIYCTSLTSITIPDSVTSIGSSAFEGCDNLTSITIPDSVTSIGSWAFCDCSSLTSITIPDSVTSIGISAFGYCDNLSDIYYLGTEEEWHNITIDSGNDRLYDSDVTIHYNYNSSETDIIDSGICGAEGDNLTWTLDSEGTLTISGEGEMKDWDWSAINHWAEYDIKNVCINAGVTSIGIRAFYACKNLYSVTIPKSVTSIGENAFAWSGLTSITIPTTISHIGGMAFSGTTWLTNKQKNSSLVIINDILIDGTSCKGNVIIPDSVVSISDAAFYECTELISVVIPDGISSIGNSTFGYCENLTSITIPDSVTSIGAWAFTDCISLQQLYLPDQIAFIGDCAFWGCEKITSIDLPDNLKSIGEVAFDGCYSLESITIPASVENIGCEAFLTCYSLKAINVDENNKYYASDDGILLDKEKTIIHCYPAGKTEEQYVVPDSVKIIEESAFMSCSNLTSVIISSNVVMIGAYAFRDSGLTSVVIPSSITSIANSTFCNCWNLTSIVIPSTVTTIEDFAFPNCQGLKEIYYTGSETQWNNIAIGSDNESLTNATIHYNFKLPDSEKQSVYQFFNMTLSWERAKEYCESLNGHLAVISSAEEQSIIEEQIPDISKNCYWIGAYLENDEWKWITDEPFEYENWGENLPDNYRGIEEYAHIYAKDNTNESPARLKGEWNDCGYIDTTTSSDNFYSNHNFGFICEWEDGDRELTGVIDFDVMQVAEFITNNPNYYLTSDTVELISQSKEVALLDPSVTSYLGWKDFENFISGDTTVDKYNAKLTIQTMVADLLLSDDVAHSVNDVSELASENAMNESLMLFKENAEKLNITGERLNNLENILSLGSSSIDAAKRNKWIAEFLGDVKPDLLSDTLGIASDTANMFGIIYSIKQNELSNSEDLYKLYIASIAYASANDALKESLALLKQYIDMEAEKYSSGTDVYSKRVRYVAEEFSNYYQMFIDTTGSSQKEYAEELALKMVEHTASQLAVFGIEKIIEAGLTIACPELHIVLEMLGTGFKIGMNVWESLSDVDEQALERDMFLNTLVFSDAIGNAMNDVQYGFPALVLIRLDKYSTEMYQYGIRFYQKINKMMLEHANKHQLMLAIEMPDKNWINTDDVDMILMCNAMFGTEYVEETLDIRGIVDIAEKIRYNTIDSLNDYEFQQFESVAPWDVERMVNDFYTQSFYVNHCEFYKLENEIKYHPLLIIHVIETAINAIYAIHCPVDITITKNGITIAEVKNEILTMIDETSDIPIHLIRTAENESASKYVMLPEGYELQITGNGMGTMSFEKAAIENGSVIEVSNIEDIPVTAGSVYREVIAENKTIALECDLDNDGTIDQIIDAILLGDVNSDGKLSISDAVLLARIVGEDTESTEEYAIDHCDVDSNDLVTILDVIALLKIIAK